jgi:hopene-associated glycosyltransferase HpnB
MPPLALRCGACRSVTAQVLAAAGLAAWLYLLLGRGGFWCCTERDTGARQSLPEPPAVAVIVPARDEAEHIGTSIMSLLRQDYAGRWTVILVDDHSSDGTAKIAREQAANEPSERLRIVPSAALPAGWTGKLWALDQGVTVAMGLPDAPQYLLLTDADIVHEPDSLTRLVERAHAKGLVLTSLMAKLRCESLAERVSIPGFIFFFQMLYPFPWVNRPQSAVAAAAGGCMLVRADALVLAGGIRAIRGALIDDCAMARLLKTRGAIWLGLTERVRSIRAYPDFAAIRRMVARSAYAQLRYSPLLLLMTAAAMAITYLVPPAIALFGSGPARMLALSSWALMAVAFQPTLRFYRVSPAWGFALPAIALAYLIFTLDSAYQYAGGRGGSWKGRVQAAPRS